MNYATALQLRDRWISPAGDAIAARTTRETFGEEPKVAVGITGDGKDYRIAVRIQERGAAADRMIDALANEAKGEIEVEEIGPVVGLATTVRPIVAGISVGNRFGEAGTLGCIVTKIGTTTPRYVLSNNHVLARLNFAQPDEVIEQPALLDQSGAGPFEIGRFGEKVSLDQNGPNFVDAAIVPLNINVHSLPRALFGTNISIAGRRQTDLVKQEPVYKIGKSTNRRDGRIKAWGMGKLEVTLGSRKFDFFEQIEIEPTSLPFCDSGDSGSIVLDASNLAVGLLFSKSLTTEIAYANPIGRVFHDLQIELT